MWALASGLPYYTVRDGMLLGATVGFGFAAFESAGYAFNTIVQAHAINLQTILETEITRAILAPVGHGLWTALVGGALFAGAKNGKLRVTWSLVGWLVVVMCLHILWDVSAGLSVWFTYLATHTTPVITAIQGGRIPNPTEVQARFDFMFDWLLLGLVAVIGLILARIMWHRHRAVPQTA